MNSCELYEDNYSPSITNLTLAKNANAHRNSSNRWASEVIPSYSTEMIRFVDFTIGTST